MPYPRQYAHNVTTPSTALEPPRNSLGGDYVGNAHTFRVCANDSGQLGTPSQPYSYAYTGVNFNGSTILRNTTNLGLASHDTATMCVAFRAFALGANVNIVAQTSTIPFPLVFLGSTGTITISTPNNGTNTGFVAGVAVPQFGIKANTDYVLHAAWKASTQEAVCFLNGERMPFSPNWLGTGNMPAPTAWEIGGANNIPSYNGRLYLVWFDVGQFITDPAKFYPPYNLGAQLANPGARPAIGFGGVQTAANWNAGTNLGDGTGTWTMTGAVT